MTLGKAAWGLCSTKSFINNGAGGRCASGYYWRTIRIYSSAAPKAERKLPQRRQTARLKQCQRNLGFGVLVGGVVYLVYDLYSKNQFRDGFVSYTLVTKE